MGSTCRQRRHRALRLASMLLWLASAFFGAVAATAPASAAATLALSGITPASGSAAGGTSVTITGTGFVSGARVTFGAATAPTVAVSSDAAITAITPPGTAGAVNVVVTLPDNQNATLTNGFTYAVVGLSVAAVSPSSGPVTGGTGVTITGAGFLIGATATIGGNVCGAPTVVGSTTITCTAPAGTAGAASVVVTNPGQPAATLANGYIYTAAVPIVPVTVSGISPNTGPTSGGTNVVINGSGFAAGTTVTIAGLPCANTTIFNSGKIICTTPVIAVGVGGDADVVVTSPNGQNTTVSGGFGYFGIPDPTITDIKPNVGPIAGGTTVIVSGAGFQIGATVTIGASPCSGVSVFNSGKTLSCVTGAGTAGAASVVVTNPNTKIITLGSGFKYSAAAVPTVTAVAPNTGPLAGGTSIAITGTGFATGATVTIGGAAATGVTVDATGTSIAAKTPAGTAGAANVVVTNADNQGVTAAGGFTYGAGPGVTAISPNTGPAAGGTAITVTGMGFLTGATVAIGGGACASTVVVNATTITCITPAGAGAANVSVTNPGQVASTLAGGFTYAAAAPTPLPAPPAPHPAFIPVPQSADATDHRYFPETHHTLKAGFKIFWDAHGGVAIFGLPISEEFPEQSKTDGKLYTVQYFERNRFEYHPEHKGTPYEVELGLLGVQLTADRTGETPFTPIAPFDTAAKKLFIKATGHSLSGRFRAMWEAPNGLMLLGYPITEPFEEKNADDGKTYTVQYFERARLELHPEFAGKPNEVMLGLLGTMAALQRGYLPPR